MHVTDVKIPRKNEILFEIVKTEVSYWNSLCIAVQILEHMEAQTKSNKSLKDEHAKILEILSQFKMARDLSHEMLDDWAKNVFEIRAEDPVGRLVGLEKKNFNKAHFERMNDFMQTRYQAMAASRSNDLARYAFEYNDMLSFLSKPLGEQQIDASIKAKINELDSEKIGIAGYLIMPIQRYPRHKLLFEDLAKNCEEFSSQAAEVAEVFSKGINEGERKLTKDKIADELIGLQENTNPKAPLFGGVKRASDIVKDSKIKNKTVAIRDELLVKKPTVNKAARLYRERKGLFDEASSVASKHIDEVIKKLKANKSESSLEAEFKIIGQAIAACEQAAPGAREQAHQAYLSGLVSLIDDKKTRQGFKDRIPAAVAKGDMRITDELAREMQAKIELGKNVAVQQVITMNRAAFEKRLSDVDVGHYRVNLQRLRDVSQSAHAARVLAAKRNDYNAKVTDIANELVDIKYDKFDEVKLLREKLESLEKNQDAIDTAPDLEPLRPKFGFWTRMWRGLVRFVTFGMVYGKPRVESTGPTQQEREALKANYQAEIDDTLVELSKKVADIEAAHDILANKLQDAHAYIKSLETLAKTFKTNELKDSKLDRDLTKLIKKLKRDIGLVVNIDESRAQLHRIVDAETAEESLTDNVSILSVGSDTEALRPDMGPTSNAGKFFDRRTSKTDSDSVVSDEDELHHADRQDPDDGVSLDNP